MSTNEFRIEKDSLGELEVPKDALYGIQTVRAIRNFPITGLKTNTLNVKALGMVKKASVLANNKTGHIDDERTKYIVQACDEVIEGKLNSQFITDVIQGGAGTSVNMNTNEVIANRAAQLAGKTIGTYDYIHPNDHINFGQSTNDVFPTAGKITALFLVNELLAELKELHSVLLEKSVELNDVVKPGRTHLQDAVPIRMGQEFHAYATSIARDIKRITYAFEDLEFVNMGATAVGTGINADVDYIPLCVEYLKEITGMNIQSALDLIDGTRNVDPFVWASSALKTLTVNISKMANDLRLMASGPLTGLAEIVLPARQPGSSIMPGKVNPVILEVMNQVSFQVFGNDLTILKAAEAGQLELNVFEPVLFFNLFQSLEILTNGIKTFRDNAIVGITANKERCNYLVESSLISVTALAPHIGYANASMLAKKSLAEKRNIRELVIESGLLSQERIDQIMDVNEMTEPGIPGNKK